MILKTLILSLPISLIWIGVTGYVTPGGLFVGIVVGVLCVLLLDRLGISFSRRLSLKQPVALIVYAGTILWNGLISSIKVVKLVLSPKIELKTGIVALPTGDKSPEQVLAALSAHGINMTPGQLVIDFDDQGVLYIHCLDLESARSTLEAEQTRRLGLLRDMMGVSDND